MIRVLLVDDQDLVRAGLRGILRAEFGFEIVGECADGSEVLAKARETNPDIVLMDVRMPKVGGLAACQLLQAEHPDVPILALTTFDDDQTLAGMLRSGAAGFVLKGVPAEDLHRAVRVVADGGAWLDPAVTARVLAVYRDARPANGNSQALDLLTARERDVLALVGQGHNNAEIALRLYVGEGTVKTHINHLFSKLGLRDRAAAIIFAYDHNLISHKNP
jgi:DNA-binding NarL/FixJ family response regulator